jgi:hypothetical protein
VDWLQFISSVIGSVAWPSAALGAIYMFRQKLIELLPNLNFKYKDLEANFRLKQATKDAEALPPLLSTPENIPTEEEITRFEQIAKISPRAAMIEVRTDIEEAVRSLAESSKLLTPKVQSTLGLTRLLRNKEIIDHQTSALLDDLRAIGNTAAHDKLVEFSLDDALRYRSLADRAIRQLRIAN